MVGIIGFGFGANYSSAIIVGRITASLVAAVVGISGDIGVELTTDTDFNTNILFAGRCCCENGNDYYSRHVLNFFQTYLQLLRFLLGFW